MAALMAQERYRCRFTLQIVAAAHLDLQAHLLNQTGRNVECFRFAVNEHGDLTLRMEELAFGANPDAIAADL